MFELILEDRACDGDTPCLSGRRLRIGGVAKGMSITYFCERSDEVEEGQSRSSERYRQRSEDREDC